MAPALKVDVLEARKIGKREDLSDFVMSISPTAALVGCSQSAVIRMHQMWSKEGKVANWREDNVQARLTDACRE